jgi:toxin-antitoxin system PIN domain toxin
MTLFFPDVNVWLALSIAEHPHSQEAWMWLRTLAPDARLVLARYTQLGMLRLLTNTAVMGERPLTLQRAWAVYDRWLDDPRVDFYPESRDAGTRFRALTENFARKPASNWVGDCWLLASSAESGSTLVTFDRALSAFARKQQIRAVRPNG